MEDELPHLTKSKWRMFQFGMINFVFGFRILQNLMIKDLMASYLVLEPFEAQIFQALSMCPVIIRFFLGMLSDNVPVCGMKRLSYFLMLSGIHLVALTVLVSINLFSTYSALNAIIPLVTINFTYTFLELLSDAYATVLAYEDPKDGARKVKSYAWIVKSWGRILGSLAAAGITEVFSIKWQIVFNAGMTIMDLCQVRFVYEVEKRNQYYDRVKAEQMGEPEQMGYCARVCSHLKQGLMEIIKSPPLLKLSVVAITRFIMPEFSVIMFYYITKNLGYSKFYYGVYVLMAATGQLLGSYFYKYFLSKRNFARIIWIGNLLIVIRSALYCAFTGNMIIPQHQVTLLAIGLYERMFKLTFGEIPMSVYWTHYTPIGSEASVSALFKCFLTIHSIIVGPFLGAFIIDQLGITSDNFDNLYIAYIIQGGLTLIATPIYICLNIQNIQAKEEVKVGSQVILDEDKKLQDIDYAQLNASDHASIDTSMDAYQATNPSKIYSDHKQQPT